MCRAIGVQTAQDLYHMHFEETEVTPQQFKQLIDKGTWQDARRGEVIVRNGRPLGSVILFHKGHADAVGSDGTILYTYGGGATHMGQYRYPRTLDVFEVESTSY